ncbi:DUF4352 domain-containing protein [Nonomuraea sp. NPDC050404]|uniref:DUF4352 domain-containing protein n=1 Tax=Nonomuraea sp. NPDC050404 TaxID=3155783 RepID=UPI0033EAC383
MGYPQDPRPQQQERPAFEPHSPELYRQRQPYESGPQYVYSPPTPPHPRPPRRRTGFVVALAVGIPLLLFAGFATAWLVLVVPVRDAGLSSSGQPSPGPTSEEPVQVLPDGGDGARTLQSKTGETLTLKGREAGLTMAVTVNQVFDRAESTYGRQPQGGHRFMAVQLTLTNKGRDTYNDSPAIGAAVIDAESQEYPSVVAEVKQGRQFGGTTSISPGDTRKGLLVFEVPERAKLVKFQFGLDGGYAEQRGEWTLG